jgi:hypothetical protein
LASYHKLLVQAAKAAGYTRALAVTYWEARLEFERARDRQAALNKRLSKVAKKLGLSPTWIY